MLPRPADMELLPGAGALHDPQAGLSAVVKALILVLVTLCEQRATAPLVDTQRRAQPSR